MLQDSLSSLSHESFARDLLRYLTDSKPRCECTFSLFYVVGQVHLSTVTRLQLLFFGEWPCVLLSTPRLLKNSLITCENETTPPMLESDRSLCYELHLVARFDGLPGL
jgi:hypothetical protein